jgi:hypothetical protein
MDDAPLIIKWEMHRIARHCSVVLENTSMQYSPAWEDQSLFRDALKGMRCFQGKVFPEACDTQVWLRSFTDGSQSREAVVFKAVLHLDLKTGDVRLDFELPTLEKSCRLRRKFASDRFIDLQLLTRNRSHADNPDKALAKWLVRSRHVFLSREWTAFFIDDTKTKSTNATSASGLTEERQVILFAEQGQGLESYVLSPAMLTEAQPPVRAICDRSTLLNWLL